MLDEIQGGVVSERVGKREPVHLGGCRCCHVRMALQDGQDFWWPKMAGVGILDRDADGDNDLVTRKY